MIKQIILGSNLRAVIEGTEVEALIGNRVYDYEVVGYSKTPHLGFGVAPNESALGCPYVVLEELIPVFPFAYKPEPGEIIEVSVGEGWHARMVCSVEPDDVTVFSKSIFGCSTDECPDKMEEAAKDAFGVGTWSCSDMYDEIRKATPTERIVATFELGEVVSCHSGCFRVYAGDGEVFAKYDSSFEPDYNYSYKCSEINKATPTERIVAAELPEVGDVCEAIFAEGSGQTYLRIYLGCLDGIHCIDADGGDVGNEGGVMSVNSVMKVEPTERIEGHPDIELGEKVRLLGYKEQYRLYAGDGEVEYRNDAKQTFKPRMGITKVLPAKPTEPTFMLADVYWDDEHDEFAVMDGCAQVGECCTIEGDHWRIVGFTTNAEWKNSSGYSNNPCGMNKDYPFAILRKLSVSQ